MRMNEKLDSLKETIAGKAKEAEGRVTKDPLREAQGKVEAEAGKLKGKVADAKDAVKDKVDELRDRE